MSRGSKAMLCPVLNSLGGQSVVFPRLVELHMHAHCSAAVTDVLLVEAIRDSASPGRNDHLFDHTYISQH